MNRIKEIARQAKRALSKQPVNLLSETQGVIHVGANKGQERNKYANYDLNVIWIEPIPEVFNVLQNNIKDLSKQTAYQYLITDIDNKLYEFNIADNFGESSSILEFKYHQDIWPDVKFNNKITLSSSTLPSFIYKEGIDMSKFDTLIMDTQGTELLVLKGAESLLSQFKFIKTEAADFEAYKDCCQLDDLDQYLAANHFEQIAKKAFAQRDGGGRYYNVTYRNTEFPKK